MGAGPNDMTAAGVADDEIIEWITWVTRSRVLWTPSNLKLLTLARQDRLLSQ